MNISINLGNWNSVFAVPTSIVDSHIKLAGAAQLKVLLFILRNAGASFNAEDISKFLSMHKADVKDALLYWNEVNVIAVGDDQIVPGVAKTDQMSGDSCGNFKDKLNKAQGNIEELKNKDKQVIPPRPVSKPRKPDSKFIAKRIQESEQIAFLIQEAQIILSRLMSEDDIATLIMLHDTDGLPIDVIIMLLQYAVSMGKKNMKYIEKIGIEWGHEEIDSIEKAESKIIKLENHKEAWTKIEKAFNLEQRLPTPKESEAADRWLNKWSMPIDLILEAYNRCIDSIGKYRLAYVDKVLMQFYKSGIKTVAQANEERKKNKAKYKEDQMRSPSYDIDEYEKRDMFM